MIHNGTNQLQTSQGAGKSRPHSGASQSSDQYSQDQSRDPRAAEGGGQASRAEEHGAS